MTSSQWDQPSGPLEELTVVLGPRFVRAAAELRALADRLDAAAGTLNSASAQPLFDGEVYQPFEAPTTRRRTQLLAATTTLLEECRDGLPKNELRDLALVLATLRDLHKAHQDRKEGHHGAW